MAGVAVDDVIGVLWSAWFTAQQRAAARRRGEDHDCYMRGASRHPPGRGARADSRLGVGMATPRPRWRACHWCTPTAFFWDRVLETRERADELGVPSVADPPRWRVHCARRDVETETGGTGAEPSAQDCGAAALGKKEGPKLHGGPLRCEPTGGTCVLAGDSPTYGGSTGPQPAAAQAWRQGGAQRAAHDDRLVDSLQNKPIAIPSISGWAPRLCVSGCTCCHTEMVPLGIASAAVCI